MQGAVDMSHIKYDEKKKVYYATGKRPNNQSSPATLEKIAERLKNYVLIHRDVCLTDLQKLFVEEVSNHKKAFLSPDDIDIAHHIAISKIISVFVAFMNDPDSIACTDFENFADAICSTESPTDDKGRSTLRGFFNDIQDNLCSPRELCASANKIIKLLNSCTRNLIPGNKSVNRSIGENKDLHMVAKRGKPGFYKETEPSKRISQFFEQLPDCQDYAPKLITTPNKEKALLSSSIFAKRDESYVVKDKARTSYKRFGA